MTSGPAAAISSGIQRLRSAGNERLRATGLSEFLFLQKLVHLRTSAHGTRQSLSPFRLAPFLTCPFFPIVLFSDCDYKIHQPFSLKEGEYWTLGRSHGDKRRSRNLQAGALGAAGLLLLASFGAVRRA